MNLYYHNMKRVKQLITIAILLTSSSIFSQAKQQLNFGLIGVTYDIPATTDIAISPFAGTGFDLDYLIIGVKGNYYFDNLLALPDAWDVYGGINGGYGFGVNQSKNGDFDIGLQVGGRWFWNPQWGLYLELGGGKLGPTGGLGISMRL